MENWKSVVIWACSWPCGRPHHQHRLRHPDNSWRRPGDGYGSFEAFYNQLCDVSESVSNKCSEVMLDSLLVIWRNRQDWSSPEILCPSMCLHFQGKWNISMIAFITDIVYQDDAKISYSCAAMVNCCIIPNNSINRFSTNSCTKIRYMVTLLLAEDTLLCPSHSCEERSRFPAYSNIFLMISSGVQVSICSYRNFGSHLPDILLWHIQNGNEK